MNSGTVDANFSALCYLAASCVPFLFSTKESKLHITMFAKVSASVYGIFLHSVLSPFNTSLAKASCHIFANLEARNEFLCQQL